MNSIGQKKLLRQEMREKRQNLSREWKEVYDKKINAHLLQIARENGVQSIHTYLPIGSEIDVREAISNWHQQGLQIICPKVLAARKLEHRVYRGPDQLESGYFNTRHPIGRATSPENVEMVLVPGLAFDPGGNRLGYGSAYYDNFLPQLPKAFKVGLAYPFQVLPKIPLEPHDMPLDHILYLPD